MSSKFLPIGSICTLKGRTGKIMIIGLYSTLFDNDIVVYDYKGCAYPEGLTLSNQLFSFNQEDIEKIEFKGYENEEFSKLLLTLGGKLSKEDISSVKTNAGFPAFSNFVFDENGYVVKADSTSLNNPFVNNLEISKSTEENNIFRNIKFDKNGTVISVDEDSKNETTTTSEYEFDENGVVIETNQDSLNNEKEPTKETTSEYEFDENGVVIATNQDSLNNEKEPTKETTSEYEFDENGVVIATNQDSLNNEKEPTKETTSESVNEESIPDIEYEFDENGVIIGIKS